MPSSSAGDLRRMSGPGFGRSSVSARTSVGSTAPTRNSLASSGSAQSLTLGSGTIGFAIDGADQVHELAAQLANARAAVVEAEDAARREREAAERHRLRAEKAADEAGTLRETLQIEQHAMAVRKTSIEGGDFLNAQVQNAYTELSAENVLMSQEATQLSARLEQARAEQHKLRAASAHRRSELMLQKKAAAISSKKADSQLELAISSLSTERARASLLEAEKQRLAQAERDAAHRAELLAEENGRLAQRADEHAAAAQRAVDETRALKATLKRTHARQQSSRRKEAATRDEVHRLSLQLQAERQGVVREKAEERKHAALLALLRQGVERHAAAQLRHGLAW